MSSDLDLFGGVSTADDGERSAYDFYETPAWMTRSLLHYERDIWCPRATVLECCSGRDAITRVLRAYGATVVTNDLDKRHPAMTHADATDPGFWRTVLEAGGVDWVVTNPPFAIAFDLLVQAHAVARMGVAFLLRKTFLEPTKDRGLWLSKYPPSRLIGEPRFNFRGEGSGDSVSCDWYIWEKFSDGSYPIVIDHLAERRIRDEVTR